MTESVLDRPPVFEARGIAKSFGGITALEEVTLALRPGVVTALVGDNGAGKSTFVKCMTGVIQPDHGVLRVDGQDVEFRDPRAARRHGIQSVFQDLALVESLSIIENMYLCSELRIHAFGIPTPVLDRTRMERLASGSLRRLGTTTIQDIHAKVESLSGGQRQSIAIARAVLEEAKVVILDEPTAALGVEQSRQVLNLIARLREEGTAVMVISHNLREVFEVSDQVAVMRLGRLRAIYETSTVTEEEVVAAIMGAEGARS
ncbi:ATP-binding cassette domain-containing protein [Microbacterium tumbae]